MMKKRTTERSPVGGFPAVGEPALREGFPPQATGEPEGELRWDTEDTEK